MLIYAYNNILRGTIKIVPLFIFIYMDIKNDIDFKMYRYSQYNEPGQKPYDYARFGILNKCLPKILFKGNSLLVSFLQIIDVRMVMLFKYIDKLKHFKHITWY